MRLFTKTMLAGCNKQPGAPSPAMPQKEPAVATTLPFASSPTTVLFSPAVDHRRPSESNARWFGPSRMLSSWKNVFSGPAGATSGFDGEAGNFGFTGDTPTL